MKLIFFFTKYIILSFCILIMHNKYAIADPYIDKLNQCISLNLNERDKDESFKLIIFMFSNKDSLNQYFNASEKEKIINKKYIGELIRKILIEKCHKESIDLINNSNTHIFTVIINKFAKEFRIKFLPSKYTTDEIKILTSNVDADFLDKYINNRKNGEDIKYSKRSIASCIITNLQPEDRNTLIKWLFFSISENPLVKDYYRVSNNEKLKYISSSEKIVEKVVTQYCTNEIVKYKDKIGKIPIEHIVEFFIFNTIDEFYSDKSVISYLRDYTPYFDNQVADMLKIQKDTHNIPLK